MAVIKDRDITTELRGALIEAKEAMDGKRKLNTLDRLIEKLQTAQTSQGKYKLKMVKAKDNL